MATMWNAADRASLLARIERLDPSRPAAWGRMSCPQMVSHLIDALRMAFGELPVQSKRLPLRYTPIKQLVIYLLPFPKGAPTAPELLARSPAEWAADRARLAEQIGRWQGLSADFAWPEHPAFGVLSRRAWGVLGYRHIDHHLRQFGA
jgi:hypothetical protein